MEEGIQRDLADIYRGRRGYLKSPTYLVGLPNRPIESAAGPGQVVGRGYFQYIDDLDAHVSFRDGRMATDLIEQGPKGPVVEAVLGTSLADLFGLRIGDEIVLTPAYGERTRVSARLVGIIEATDPREEYWQRNASIFLEPAPLAETPDAGVEINPQEPPIALFTTLDSMVQGLGEAYPGTLVNSTWLIFVDKQPLKEWSIEETRDRIGSFKTSLSSALPGATTLTGIERLLDDFETRSFFSSVPLLLLLTIMVITVLYYLAMMVAYLVQSREGEVALLRGRGVSTLQMLRIYALEGLTLAVVGVVAAPFLAMGAIALAGKLPYFREITGGDLLIVELQWLPFAAAALTGLLALAIFVVPRAVGSRSGLVIHRLRSSRPPSEPLLQRYYLDVALMVLGGLVFWELQAKGQIVSGGLFEDVRVNEALLLAPVLYLTVVALVFLRLFPLFVRFISGESPLMLHLAAGATFTSLGAIKIVAALRDETGGTDWTGPVLVLAAAAAVYWLTSRADGKGPKAVGLAAQAGLIALFGMMEPPVAGENALTPTISLFCIVPAQILFMLFKASVQFAPVWVSVGLWHMARNPLQYSWLVLLLVMVTGLGLLATTVGGTLDRSHEQRILYEVAADVRVGGMSAFGGGSREGTRERFLDIPGVTDASLGLRTRGKLGATGLGSSFDVLAVEPERFHDLSWWRDDFASQSLDGLMRALQPLAGPDPLVLPEGTASIGMWIKPERRYPNVLLWVVVEDSRKIVRTLTVGELDLQGWNRMIVDVPSRLRPPIRLLAVQLWEPGFGPTGTPGEVVLDDLHAIGPDGETVLLDGFEERLEWLPTPTSAVSIDVIERTDDAFSDEAAAKFIFGKETNRGIRGISHASAGGPVPLVISSSFSERTGYNVGDFAVFSTLDRLIPVAIRGEVDLFPTMHPEGFGFVVADLDSALRHLNILSPLASIVPNEVLMNEAPGAGGAVRDALLNLPPGSVILDRESALESVRLDPLVTAGWRAMGLLAVAIILFTAASGCATYMLAFSGRGRTEAGFMRSLGMSRRQLSGLLSLEHVVVLVMGLSLGTWSGIEMSRRMVASVAVTDQGDAVLPPFSLITDWALMGPIYVVLLVVFGVALYALDRSMRGADIQTIARLEG